MAEIVKGDIVEQGAIQEVLDLKKAFEGCSTSLKDVIKTSKDLTVNIKSAESTRTLSSETKKLTIAQQELQKVEKQIQVVQAKNNEDYIKQAKLLAEAKELLKQKTTATQQDTKAINAQNSSLQTLDKALQKNRDDYAKLANEQARNSVEGKKLLEVIQKQDAASKHLSQTLGQAQKNVGNYPAQLAQSIPILGGIASRSIEAGTGIKGMANEIKSLLIQMLKFLATPLGASLALIAGTVALIGKSVSLFFDDTLKGQEKLNELMATYDATVATIKEGMVDLGESIVNSFSNGTAIQDFGNSLLDLAELIANPIAALADLNAKAVDFAIKVEEKKRIAIALAKIENELVREHIKDVVDDGNTELKVNELLEKSKDKLEYSDKKRLSFLKQAVELLREQVKGDIELAEKDLKAAEKKIELNGGIIKQNKLLSEYTDEELYALKTNAAGVQQLADKQVALLKIKADAAAKEKTFTKLISTAQLEIEKSERDRIERTLKAEEDLQRKRIEGVVNANNAILKDENTSLQEKEDALQSNLKENSKIYELDAQNAIRSLKNSIRDRLIAESEDYSDATIDNDKSFVKERDAILTDAHNKELANLQGYFAGVQTIYTDSYKQVSAIVKSNAEDRLIVLQDELIKGKITVEKYEKEKVKLQHESNQAGYRDLLNNLKAKIEALKNNKQDVTALLKALHDIEVQLSNDATQKIIEDEKEKADARKKELDAQKEAAKYIQGQLTDINNQVSSNQITKLDQELKAFQDVQQSKLDAVKSSEEEQTLLAGDNEEKKKQILKQSKAEQDKINAESAKKERQINSEKNVLIRRQAVFEKGLAIIQAGINVEQAATKALTAGPIIGPILAGLVIALGAAQIALIASKPIPQFFKGTDSAPGGLAWVGEQGTELIRKPGGKFELTPSNATLMDVPRGTEIVPHDKTMKMLAMSALMRNGGSVQEKDSVLVAEVKKLNSNIGNIKQQSNDSSRAYISGLIAYEAKKVSENHIKHQRIISLGKWVK